MPARGSPHHAGTARTPARLTRRCGSAPSRKSPADRATTRRPARATAPTVRQVTIGQQEHRRPVLGCDASRFERGRVAVRRRARRDNRHRSFTVATEHRLQQVGLFGLGRQPGRRTASLHIDDDQRQLEHHPEPDRLALQRNPRTRCRRHTQTAAERCTKRRSHTGDLVFSLERPNAERLVLREFVQDVGRRGDGVGAKEQRQTSRLRRPQQARTTAPGCRRCCGTCPPSSVRA